jgi:hypothetical protein
MALEIAGVVLDKLTSIEASEAARFARHAVPGLNGDYVQDLGRPSVRIRVRGIFYGDDAADRLKTLRGHLLDRAPVDFLCELTGEGYFSQVVVDDLSVAERAGRPDEFDFECVVTEYVPPPPPPATSVLGDLDTGILSEAASLMDAAQDALSQVAGLASLLSGAADFGNPTTRLPSMLDSFKGAAGGATSTLSTIGGLI